MSDPGPVVHCVAVRRHYVTEAETVRAVDGVDCEAWGGEFLCLYGHSGSGKTTLLNLIAGLDLPTSGHVTIDGIDTSEVDGDRLIRMRRETVGMVHQAHLLIEEFTAAENVSLPLEARGMGTGEALEQAGALLERVGLGNLRGRFPRELSGGQKQRVGLARALSGGRRILLADEPTGSLDSANAQVIFEMLAGLAEEGRLVIVASHDPSCRTFASRSLHLRDGKEIIGAAT